jgi:hypothetical protein
VLLGDLTEDGDRPYSGVRVKHVDATLFALDGVEEPVKICQAGSVALHVRHIPADQGDRIMMGPRVAGRC